MTKQIEITKKYVAFTRMDKDRVVIDDKTDALLKGKHPLQDHFGVLQTDDKAIYDSWKPFSAAVVCDETEIAIQNKMKEILRRQAVEELKDEGKLSEDFEDTKGNKHG